MARLHQLVVDCHHAAPLARFWEAALDDFSIRPYDDEEIARLAAAGHTPETDPVVILDGPNGLELCFQEVDVPPIAKKPMHVDLVADDRAAEVERLVALGASVHRRFEGHTWMRDPEGNDFCVTDP
jgi:hypothetical protein